MTDLDVELLVIALVPDLDSRFERLYGYLNDDVTRRRATIGLALTLADASSASSAARARLLPGAPLIDLALVEVEDTDRPFLTRALRVPDRVTAHLLGDDAADPALVGLLTEPVSFDGRAVRRGWRWRLAAGQRLIYVREAATGIGPSVAAAALRATGRSVIGVDLARLAVGRDPQDTVTVLGREALLRGAGVVAGPVEAWPTRPHPEVGLRCAGGALRRLADLPLPVAIVGSVTWDPGWTDSVPLLIDAPTLSPAERIDAVAAERCRRSTSQSVEPADDRRRPESTHVAVPVHFVLGPGQVRRAVLAAAAGALIGTGAHDGRGPAPRGQGAERGRPGTAGPPGRAGGRLGRHRAAGVGAQPAARPGGQGPQSRPGAAGVADAQGRRARSGRDGAVRRRLRHRQDHVRRGDRRRTGLDLYTVNLATVVDKYVGETEKNLERIFAEAGGVNAVLLFDEADAIFGKRSEVRDAHDRYANIESAYLLQRMETFDGLAILATNLRSNIDEAFTRRLDMIIDFPPPDEQSRLAIWQRCLLPPVPCAPDLDLDFCAKAFALSGGNIRSAATTAGYLAAGRSGAVGMPELISAIQQEYRKLGRLVLEREFGPYFSKPTVSGPHR